MADREKRLIEELEKRLVWYREEAPAAEFDVEEIDAICIMLQKLSPLGPHRTEEEAYGNIMRRVRQEEGEAGGEVPRKDRSGKAGCFRLRGMRLRTAVIFAVVAGILASLNMVTYAREDKSLFTVILEKVGVLKIERGEKADESAFDAGEMTKGFYGSWAELDGVVKEKIVLPTYMPEGYSLYGIRYWNHEDRETIHADYCNQENGHVLIGITLWEDNVDPYSETVMDEAECRLLPEHSDRDTLYYEYGDEYICIVIIGNSSYRIFGNISLEEIRKIGEGLRSGGQK